MTDSAQRPGWYPDPDGVAAERWWNGVDWSDNLRGTTPGFAAPPAMTAPAGMTPAAQTVNPYAPAFPSAVAPRTNPAATAGFIIGVVAFLINIFVFPSIIATVLSWRGMVRGRQLRAQGYPANQYGVAVAGFVLGLLGAASGALLLFFYLWALSRPNP